MIKGFREWLVESSGLAQPRVKDFGKLGKTWLWVDNRTHLPSLFGNGIFQLTVWSKDIDWLLGILSKTGQDLDQEFRPIMAKGDGDMSGGRVRLWFGIDNDKLFGRINFQTAEHVTLISASASGLGLLMDEIDPTFEQILEAISWAEGRLSPPWVDHFREKMKEKPQWQDDITDWALGDW